MTDSNVVTRRRVPFLPTLAVGFVTSLVGVLANSGANYAVGWTGWAPWLAVPVAGVLAGLVTTFFTTHLEARSADSSDPNHPPSFTGVSVPVAALLVIVLLGVGGYFAARGAKSAVEWFTGNEPGQEILAAPVRTEKQGLALAVDSIEETAHFTRVEVTARNNTSNTLTMPVFGSATFTGRDGTTLEADPRRSDWTDSLPPGARQSGVLVFPDGLPSRVRRAALNFAKVFPAGFEGPRSITVPGMRLQPRE